MKPDRSAKDALRAGFAMIALAVPAAAHAQLIEVQWDSNGRFDKQVEVPAGKFVEVCEKLQRGTKVQWRFDGSAPTNFNIHYHEGKEVRFPAKEDNVSRSQGVLDVAVEQDYCWMWANKGKDAVALNVGLIKGS